VANETKADGRSARWNAHRQTRRAELVRAAMAAVEQHGASVGMDQIAAVAGTSKAVFYRHFTDKADLYRAVGQQMAQVFSDQLSGRMSGAPDVRAMVAGGIDTYLETLEKTPELYRFVVRNPVLEQAGGAGAVDYTSVIAGRIDQTIALAAGPDRDLVLRRPWGTAIVGLMKSAGDWWLDNPGVLSRAELTESLTGLLWNGTSGLVRTASTE
jgi:AcrR family transcriptional regulator